MLVSIIPAPTVVARTGDATTVLWKLLLLMDNSSGVRMGNRAALWYRAKNSPTRCLMNDGKVLGGSEMEASC